MPGDLITYLFFFSAYVQEIGRCGRDGQQSSSTVYANKTDLAGKHLSHTMKEYCTTTDCRRNFILKYFNFEENSNVNSHHCCDNCRKSCLCQLCSNKNEINEVSNIKDNTEISKKKKMCAKSMLEQYFLSENKKITDMCIPAMETGLSPQLITKLISDIALYSSADRLGNEFPSLETHYVNNISHLLSKVHKLNL